MSKNIDWSSLGFGYVQTDKRFVSNYKNGAWDDGVLTEDATVNLSECAGVLQYAQTCFEGLKAYTTEKGQIVIFRPDLNASRMADSCKRLEMPVYFVFVLPALFLHPSLFCCIFFDFVHSGFAHMSSPYAYFSLSSVSFTSALIYSIYTRLL